LRLFCLRAEGDRDPTSDITQDIESEASDLMPEGESQPGCHHLTAFEAL